MKQFLSQAGRLCTLNNAYHKLVLALHFLNEKAEVWGGETNFSLSPSHEIVELGCDSVRLVLKSKHKHWIKTVHSVGGYVFSPPPAILNVFILPFCLLIFLSLSPLFPPFSFLCSKFLWSILNLWWLAKGNRVICVPQKLQHVREETLKMWLHEALEFLWEDGN